MKSLSKWLTSPDSPGVGERKRYSFFVEGAFLAQRFSWCQKGHCGIAGRNIQVTVSSFVVNRTSWLCTLGWSQWDGCISSSSVVILGSRNTWRCYWFSHCRGCGNALHWGARLLLKSRFCHPGEASSVCGRFVVSSAPTGLSQEWAKGCFWSTPLPLLSDSKYLRTLPSLSAASPSSPVPPSSDRSDNQSCKKHCP